MTPHYSHRVDANQAEIVYALRAVGATVADISIVGKGIFDLLVGYDGKNYLMEVKTRTGKLTPQEAVFLSGWNGQAVIVHSAEEALAVLGVLA